MPTVTELRAECKRKGIKGYSKLKKAELEELCFKKSKLIKEKKSSKKERKITKKVITKSYLGGMNYLTEIKSEQYNKHIYIFGEAHNTKGECSRFKPVSKFIIEQISRGELKTVIDIFVESDYIDKKETDEITYTKRGELGALRTELKSCLLVVSKDKCIYPNIRAHYIDIRGSTISPFFNELFDLVFEMYYAREEKDTKEIKSVKLKFNELKEQYPISIENYGKTETKREYFEYFKSNYNHLLEKQLSKIVYPEIKDKIIRFTTNEFNIHFEKYKLF